MKRGSEHQEWEGAGCLRRNGNRRPTLNWQALRCFQWSRRELDRGRSWWGETGELDPECDPNKATLTWRRV